MLKKNANVLSVDIYFLNIVNFHVRCELTLSKNSKIVHIVSLKTS